jgi:hypothetical protein
MAASAVKCNYLDRSPAKWRALVINGGVSKPTAPASDVRCRSSRDNTIGTPTPEATSPIVMYCAVASQNRFKARPA